MWLLLVAFLPQASAIKTPLAMTSLEQVMTRAYNARILDGTFDTIYSGLENVFPQPFCSGDISDWPLPEVVPSTDLAAVLERGVFRCGWIENVHYVTTPENVVTIASGNATNQVTGLMADWWLSIVDYVSEESGLGFLDLEWRLYPSSQASFEALAAGEVDALCASWAPDGVYKTPDGEAVARAALFSMQTCPTFLQQKFLFVPSTSPMTTFEELIAAINDGSVTDVCVTGIAGGGFETSCQNTLSLYADGTVTCTGFGEGSFAALGQGTCQAIWDGSPPDGEAANYIAIPLPFFYAPTSYFRQADLPESDPPKSEQTSLELAVTKSFESIIEKGAWNELFDGLISIKPASFCFGDTAVWPLPAAEEGTDLAAVLERGSLRCGYAKNQAFFTADGITLLDTSNPEDIQGLVANLFEQIVADLAVRYNMSLDLEWILLDSSVETFTALANNEVDSACGWWIPNGDWTNPDSGEVLARPLAFSMMQCPTLMQLRPVFTLIESGIDSYTALIEAIEATAGPFYVCVPGKCLRSGCCVKFRQPPKPFAQTTNLVEERPIVRIACPRELRMDSPFAWEHPLVRWILKSGRRLPSTTAPVRSSGTALSKMRPSTTSLTSQPRRRRFPSFGRRTLRRRPRVPLRSRPQPAALVALPWRLRSCALW